MPATAYDSAGYGLATITRSVSIVNDGAGTAGIRPDLGGVGITINAGASDVVHRRMFQLLHESCTLKCIRHNYVWLPTVPE